MLKLEQLAQICSGMAWAAGNLPYIKEDFEVDVYLPFPFYDALQKELASMVNEVPAIVPADENTTTGMKFMEIRFPNGILVHIKQSDDKILIERTTTGKFVQMTNVSFLSPNGGANRA